MQNDQYSFIVRIWQEAEGREKTGPTWRGSIDDISTNKRLYFNDLAGITRFIEEQVGSIADKSHQPWTARLAHKGGFLISQFQNKFARMQLFKRHGKHEPRGQN